MSSSGVITVTPTEGDIYKKIGVNFKKKSIVMGSSASGDKETAWGARVHYTLSPKGRTRTIERWNKVILPLTENHPRALRELWLVAVYQAYSCGVSWREAGDIVGQRIRQYNGGILRSYPDRRQVLGARRQEKLEYFNTYYRPEGIPANIVARDMAIEMLLHGNLKRPEIEPLAGKRVRLCRYDWNMIEAGATNHNVVLRISTPTPIRFEDEGEDREYVYDVRLDNNIPF